MHIIYDNFPKSKRHYDAACYAIEQLKNNVLSPYIEKVLLFGSCARGEETWSSDVDLCIILNKSVKTLPKYSVLMHMMKGILSDADLSSVEVDTKIFIGNDWETSDMLFCKNVKKDGKLLWE